MLRAHIGQRFLSPVSVALRAAESNWMRFSRMSPLVGIVVQVRRRRGSAGSFTVSKNSARLLVGG